MPDPDATNPPEPEESSGGGDPFAQDPHVERLRPDPSAPPAEAAVLVGLAGRSDRPDRVRLYLNRALTYYAEFRREDVVHTEPVPPEQPPMLGLKATRVGIRADAVVEYTRTTRAKARDQFDLDVQLAPGLRRPPTLQPQTIEPICNTNLCTDRCPTDFDTCFTCNTCFTCQPTQCNQNTCVTCFTCQQTQCGQATCNTCGQATCVTCDTCQTDCFGRTCVTCDTCNPHVFTCGPNPQCRF